ncbi:hypothetical protein [Reyranella sp.]|uniref:hypothetical protein n=1 Tax=Reyranella sp. TaxID=1929291 RepID=UPI003D1179CB
MPDHHHARASGRILHVFGHRFVVETAAGAILADLTPKGADRIALRVGDQVSLEGEQKPTELKVTSFTRDGQTVRIEHPPKPHHDHHGGNVDPAVVLKAARNAGYEPVGAPRRKPKHFEVLGRRDGRFTELHIELDGHIRKTKPAAGDDPKWAEAR